MLKVRRKAKGQKEKKVEKVKKQSMYVCERKKQTEI